MYFLFKKQESSTLQYAANNEGCIYDMERTRNKETPYCAERLGRFRKSDDVTAKIVHREVTAEEDVTWK
jgi:hypothetical protein